MCVVQVYPIHYGENMSPQRWQYPKSLSLWGHFLIPMRKQAYKSYINTFLVIWLYIETIYFRFIAKYAHIFTQSFKYFESVSLHYMWCFVVAAKLFWFVSIQNKLTLHLLIGWTIGIPDTHWAKTCWQQAPPSSSLCLCMKWRSRWDWPAALYWPSPGCWASRGWSRRGSAGDSWSRCSECRFLSSRAAAGETFLRNRAARCPPSCTSLEGNKNGERKHRWAFSNTSELLCCLLPI